MSDLAKFVAAIAKMKRPELHLNPEDYRRIPFETSTTTAEMLVAATGIAVVADADVTIGTMLVVDRGGFDIATMPIAPQEPR